MAVEEGWVAECRRSLYDVAGAARGGAYVERALRGGRGLGEKMRKDGAIGVAGGGGQALGGGGWARKTQKETPVN